MYLGKQEDSKKDEGWIGLLSRFVWILLGSQQPIWCLSANSNGCLFLWADSVSCQGTQLGEQNVGWIPAPTYLSAGTFNSQVLQGQQRRREWFLFCNFRMCGADWCCDHLGMVKKNSRRSPNFSLTEGGVSVQSSQQPQQLQLWELLPNLERHLSTLSL